MESVQHQGSKGEATIERTEPEKLPSGRYRIPSASIPDRVYTVDLREARCTCKGSYLGKSYCRHLQEATKAEALSRGVHPSHFASPDDGFSSFRIERRYDAFSGPVFVVIESRPAGFLYHEADASGYVVDVVRPERVASPPFSSYGGAWHRRRELEGEVVA